MDSTSASLLGRLRDRGDASAWNRFVELYTPLLLHWSQRLGLAAADAADFTQDVLVVMVQQLPTFEYDPGRSFRAWLKTILLNAWRKQLRKAGRVESLDGQADVVVGSDPESFVDEAESRDYLVRRALAIIECDFEPTTWVACRELVMHGRSAEDVARELGISVNAVYIAKSRVLRHLRAELAGMLD